MTTTRRLPGSISNEWRNRRIGKPIFWDMPMMIRPDALQFWFDPRRGVTINTTPTPDTLSALRDRSGTGVNLAQATEANQPEYNAGSGNISFTAAIEYLFNDSGYSGFDPGTGDFSVMARLDAISVVATYTIIATTATDSLNGWSIGIVSSALSVKLGEAIDIKWYVGGSSLVDSSMHTVGFTWDNSADALLLYVDGSVIAPTKFLDAVLTGDTIGGNDSFVLGCDLDEANDYEGELGAVCGYNTVLTAAEIAKLDYSFRLA